MVRHYQRTLTNRQNIAAKHETDTLKLLCSAAPASHPHTTQPPLHALITRRKTTQKESGCARTNEEGGESEPQALYKASPPAIPGARRRNQHKRNRGKQQQRVANNCCHGQTSHEHHALPRNTHLGQGLNYRPCSHASVINNLSGSHKRKTQQKYKIQTESITNAAKYTRNQ